MKTKAIAQQENGAGVGHKSSSIDELLSKGVSSERTNSHQPSAGGIQLGTLLSVDQLGRPLVAFGASSSTIAARTLVAVSKADYGRDVVLGFESGEESFPIILGLIQQPQAEMAVRGQCVTVETDDGRVIVQAKDELELRCGEAAILLQADGRIMLRGQYITSHAEAGQRIRGGSVQIN
ncbi:hypothetical protein G7047_24260 [Diaphorobacter sp. HDW4A]|uniref:DUF6484 domain-containing protein n=1 Tax=Diaphorobacter sp. HDW4A TaxID=2714924 RepID=UPI00140CE961|nr:DUF6484 domain-containing protein [Diaphorobacter sp. HDW4A]QIL82700.1 hypothetical protein G7047_24260 [Diaphorobacter sp. HDW4A]